MHIEPSKLSFLSHYRYGLWVATSTSLVVLTNPRPTMFRFPLVEAIQCMLYTQTRRNQHEAFMKTVEFIISLS
jgi:hypothetical protein